MAFKIIQDTLNGNSQARTQIASLSNSHLTHSFWLLYCSVTELRDLFCVGPQLFFMTPVTNHMLLYSTLLCEKIERAPGGHKKFMLTKLGGGGNRIDPNSELR